MKKLLSVLVVLLAGCVSSETQLAADGNWHQIGYQDGVKGHTERSYRDLSKLGAANQAEYDQGYEEGILEYCNPNVAYQIGLNGQEYMGVCDHLKSGQKFRMEWQRGWRDYNQ